MTADSVAVYDKKYKKYSNVFRLVCPKGHQYLFQAENEDEMNDWIVKINYAATFRTVGLKIRNVRNNNTNNHHKKVINSESGGLGIGLNKDLKNDGDSKDSQSRANLLRVSDRGVFFFK